MTLAQMLRFKWMLEAERVNTPDGYRSGRTVNAILTHVLEFLRYSARAGHIAQDVPERFAEPLADLPPDGFHPGETGHLRAQRTQLLKAREVFRKPEVLIVRDPVHPRMPSDSTRRSASGKSPTFGPTWAPERRSRDYYRRSTTLFAALEIAAGPGSYGVEAQSSPPGVAGLLRTVPWKSSIQISGVRINLTHIIPNRGLDHVDRRIEVRIAQAIGETRPSGNAGYPCEPEVAGLQGRDLPYLVIDHELPRRVTLAHCDIPFPLAFSWVVRERNYACENIL